MKGITYFAVVEKTDTGFGAYFPDLLGCVTVGATIEELRTMAVEALGLHLWGMEKDNEEIPQPTFPPFEDMESDSFVIPVTIYMDLVRAEMDNRSVKKTLTIPYWLNVLAEQQHVNFSQVLQGALKEHLSVK